MPTAPVQPGTSVMPAVVAQGSTLQPGSRSYVPPPVAQVNISMSPHSVLPVQPAGLQQYPLSSSHTSAPQQLPTAPAGAPTTMYASYVQLQQLQQQLQQPQVLSLPSQMHFVSVGSAPQGSRQCLPVAAVATPTSSQATSAPRRQVPVVVEVVSSSSPAPPVQLAGSRRAYVPPHCPNRVQTVEYVEHLEPSAVHDLLQKKHCVLVDLRSEDRVAGLIDGALHIPAIGNCPFITRIDELAREWADEPLIIFTCQYSAHRAPQCANWYRQKANAQQRVAILSGGFRGWEASGLPVQVMPDEKSGHAADGVAMKLGTEFVQTLPAQAAQPQHPPVSLVSAVAGSSQGSGGVSTWAAASANAGVTTQAVAAQSAVTRTVTPQTLSQAQVVQLPCAPAQTGAQAAFPSQITPAIVPAATSMDANAKSPLTSQTSATPPQVISQTVHPPQLQTQMQSQAQQLQPSSQAYGLVVEPQTGRQMYVPPPCPNRVPTIAGIEHLEPMTVHDLLQEQKCIVIDLRGEDRAAGLIEGAVHVPAIDKVPFLTRVPDLASRWTDEKLVVFTCQYSAHRAPQCANWYREHANPAQRVAILSGGFRGWESVGLPVAKLPGSAIDAQVADEKALQLGSQLVQSAAVQSAHTNRASQQQQPCQVPNWEKSANGQILDEALHQPVAAKGVSGIDLGASMHRER